MNCLNHNIDAGGNCPACGYNSDIALSETLARGEDPYGDVPTADPVMTQAVELLERVCLKRDAELMQMYLLGAAGTEIRAHKEATSDLRDEIGRRSR